MVSDYVRAGPDSLLCNKEATSTIRKRLRPSTSLRADAELAEGAGLPTKDAPGFYLPLWCSSLAGAWFLGGGGGLGRCCSGRGALGRAWGIGREALSGRG